MHPKERKSDTPDGRGLSQFIFVAVGLGIITAGLWSLYMANAPYHPGDEVTQGGLYLAGE